MPILRLLETAGNWFEEFPKRQYVKSLAREKAEVAKRFNDLYCYDKQYVEDQERLPGTGMFGITPKGGNRWMCPTCNKIHTPLSCSAWSGLQYPACCAIPEGHRLDFKIRVIKR